MMKRYAVLGIIIALVVSIAAIGCSSGSSKPKSTPTKTPTATVAPTTEPTEEPEEVGEIPSNYKFFMDWFDSTGNSGEMQYWVKGDKWRTDWSATQDGMESEMVLIYDGQFAYMYMSDMNQVFKYATSWEMANPGAAYAEEFEDGYYGDVSEATILAGFQAGCSGGASIEGNEMIAGQQCTIFVCNFGSGVSHTWISDSGWPLKSEVTAEGYTYTTEYSNIEFNAVISDSIFDINTVAPGVPVMDI